MNSLNDDEAEEEHTSEEEEEESEEDDEEETERMDIAVEGPSSAAENTHHANSSVAETPESSSTHTQAPKEDVQPIPPSELQSTEGTILSPISRSRPLSRSPPASRHHSPASSRSHSHSRSESPSSLIERTAALSVSQPDSVRERAATEAAKHRAKQQRKYHSKRGAQRVGGRQKGSKAKMDTRVKPDKSGFWD